MGSAAERIREARRALGLSRLAFSIHDASFPAGAGDVGRGSPGSEAALELLRFAAEQGFDVLQLGPQGETAPDNPSPYDAAAFSRCTLSISAAALTRDADGPPLLAPDTVDAALAGRPEESDLRADHRWAWRAQRQLLARAFERFRSAEGAARAHWDERAAAFGRRHGAWLARDGLYEVLSALHGGRGFRDWPEPDRRLLHPRPDERSVFACRRAELERSQGEALAFHRFTQLVAHAQHEAFRRALRGFGMRVYGDLQIGLADRDVWAFRPVFLEHYRLGAPPSRTNPEGQAWGYPVLDPAQRGKAGAASALVRERAERIFADYDGVRVDHPHGLVCPWVYRVDGADALRAVRAGARLHSAAGVAGHEALARSDIALPEQIDFRRDPWDDDRVRDLEPEQVERYAELFVELARVAERSGGGVQALVCEVLSTQPHPLGRVLEHFGLGRLRVTGKLDPDDASDPYRMEAAREPDWVMIGTHDTPSVWQLVDGWSPVQRRARAAYAADRLEPAPERRAAFAETLAREPGLLAQAMLAELFASRAENALVFFADLLGLADSYNRPGTVSESNWSLRAPPDFRRFHAARVAEHRALDTELALAMALRARGGGPEGLVEALFEAAAGRAALPGALRGARS